MKYKETKNGNSIVVKFDNKRVIVYKLKNDSYGIVFKRIVERDQKPTCKQIIEGDKISSTYLRISKDAAIALISSLNILINKL